MTKNIHYAAFFMILSTCASAGAENGSAFFFRNAHNAGVTKCDAAINRTVGPQSGFDIFSSFDSGAGDDIQTNAPVDKRLKKIDAHFVLGSAGDSILVTLSVIQDVGTCYISMRSTITYSSTCDKSIDGDFWNKVSNYSTNDYSRYVNPGGVDMYAKDIKVGNFNMCIHETVVLNEYPVDKGVKK